MGAARGRGRGAGGPDGGRGDPHVRRTPPAPPAVPAPAGGRRAPEAEAEAEEAEAVLTPPLGVATKLLAIDGLASELVHQKELSAHRLSSLEEGQKDHETRIRGLQDGVTSFRVWSGLANGGASIMSIIAFIKAFISG